MTYDLSISPEKQLVYLTLEGPYSIVLLKNLIKTIVESRDYDRNFNVLMDFKMVEFDPSDEDLKSLSNHVQVLAGKYPAKLARVIYQKKLRDFYSQLVTKETEMEVSSRIFSSVKDAMAWFES